MISDSVAAQFSSGSLWLALVGLALATLLSEDLTCIGAGLLIASNKAPFLPVLAACMVGIFMGDIILVAIGRTLGRPMLEMRLVRTRVSPERIERAERWFKTKGGRLVLATRFMPGIRVPAYLAAGILRVPWPPFIGWFALGCVIWTPLLVGGTVWAGERLLVMFHAWERTVPLLLGGGILIWIMLKLGIRLSSWQGRRILRSRCLRLTRWTCWPRWAKYPPIVLYVLGLGLRYRGLTLFAAANLDTFSGGSPDAVTGAIQSDRIATPAWPEDSEILETKGDEIGNPSRFDVIYVRNPAELRGRILAILDRNPLSVTGDGTLSLEELILADDRMLPVLEAMLDGFSSRLDDIPTRGEVVVLRNTGKGPDLDMPRSADALQTPAILASLDALGRPPPGLHMGRFHLRAVDPAAFQKGEFKIAGLDQGITSIMNPIDPWQSLWGGWRLQCRLWRSAFRKGAENVRRGAAKPTLGQAWSTLRMGRRST
ncbi:MAG: VTT domain-containing protein [Opitutaceae bacterium]|nr:VTT domain-containing protein [Opitutaceae bacterium]